MFKKQFEMIIERMREIDPDLKEENIKPILWDIEKQYNFNLDPWLNYIRKQFKDEPELIVEFNYLYDKYCSLETDYRTFRVDNIYKSIVAGEINNDGQIYKRTMIPYSGVEIEVSWVVNKALDLIRKHNLKAELFQITRMNISYSELDRAHLTKVKGNKTPGILLNYEPYAGEDYQYFLIDGNHRMFSILQRKNRQHNFESLQKAIAKQIKTEGSVFIFKSEEILSCMQHPIFQYFYLLQLLFIQMKEYEQNQKELVDIIKDSNSRYNQVKSVVVEE